MAEFQEVMKQWRRFCKSHSNCGKCEFDGKGICGKTHLSDVPYSDMELCIMAWAAEHPVVYPTWAEWLNSTGLTKHDTGQFCVHTPNQYTYEVKGVDILNEAAYKPIPADIAQKLGLKPKGE